MLPDRCVPFVIHSSSVLSTPISARPHVPDHAHILGSILASSSSVVAGDGVYYIAVLLDPPGLSSGKSGMVPTLHRVKAAHAAGLATPPESLAGPPSSYRQVVVLLSPDGI